MKFISVNVHDITILNYTDHKVVIAAHPICQAVPMGKDFLGMMPKKSSTTYCFFTEPLQVPVHIFLENLPKVIDKQGTPASPVLHPVEGMVNIT